MGSQMTSDAFEEIEHTADWAIHVRGRDLRALFINAALGMATLMADVKTIELNIERQIGLEEFDVETLLVSWLSELLWFNEDTDAVFVRYDIATVTPTQLKATVWGGPASSQWKHIKAVTFHGLQIGETDDGYEVTVVFDV
jgi:SHS2 domain-containing protein